MKKQLMRVVNANYSRFFKTAVLVLSLTGAYAATYATPASQGIMNGGPGVGKTEVSHLASDGESLLFEVKVENASGEKFYVLVKDENNNTLYRGSFSGKEFNKKFRLPKSESNHITFIVRGESGVSTETFQINTNRRVVEEVVVTKVS